MARYLGLGVLMGIGLILIGGLAIIFAGTAGSGAAMLLSGCLLYGLSLIALAIERS